MLGNGKQCKSEDSSAGFLNRELSKRATVISIAIIAVVGLGVIFANAATWTGPGTYTIQNGTPTGNTDAPINIGASAQTKQGPFTIGIGTNVYPTTPAGSAALTLNGTSLARLVMNDGTGNFSQYLNSYYDTTSATHKYAVSAQANKFTTSGGTYNFQVAPSGIAGNAITWTQALFIDNFGNVGIGTTTPGAKLDVVGAGGIHATGDICTDAGGAGSKCLSTVGGTGGGTLTGGTTNYVPKWTSGTSLSGTSLIYDNGTGVGIGTTTPRTAIDVNGGIMSSGLSSSGAQGGLRGASGVEVLYSNGYIGASEINSFTRDASGVLTTYKDLYFRTNNVYFNPGDINRMTILSNGNVGIGTTTPNLGGSGARTLTIARDTTSWSSNLEQQLDSQGSGVATQSFYDSGGHSQTTIAKMIVSGSDNKTGNFSFLTSNSSGTLSSALYLKNDGTVGIGTTSPRGKLEVVSSANYSTPSGQLFLSDSASGGSGRGLTLGFQDGAIPSQITGFIQTTKATYDSSYLPLGLQALGGSVGIGTTSPGTDKLKVAGNIHATGDICTDAGGGKCLGSGTSLPSGASGMYFVDSKYSNTQYANTVNTEWSGLVYPTVSILVPANTAPNGVVVTSTIESTAGQTVGAYVFVPLRLNNTDLSIWPGRNPQFDIYRYNIDQNGYDSTQLTQSRTSFINQATAGWNPAIDNTIRFGTAHIMSSNGWWGLSYIYNASMTVYALKN